MKESGQLHHPTASAFKMRIVSTQIYRALGRSEKGIRKQVIFL
jgi:hypothetical protein